MEGKHEHEHIGEHGPHEHGHPGHDVETHDHEH